MKIREDLMENQMKKFEQKIIKNTATTGLSNVILAPKPKTIQPPTAMKFR